MPSASISGGMYMPNRPRNPFFRPYQPLAGFFAERPHSSTVPGFAGFCSSADPSSIQSRLGSEYDYVKVLDFGIVKDRPGPDATILTSEGILQGTPAFMAPELISGGRVDGRADLYSLGCTAYWGLTGQLVFQASSPTQMLLDHLQQPPVPPSELSELPIPADLEAILMMCLEKDPAARPSSALALDARLARVSCKGVWTDEKARAWWELHAPDLVARRDN
jgi:serine/threonine protein kinase